MEMKEKYSKGELAKEILKGLALGGFIVACFVAPNLAQIIKLFETKDYKDRKKLKRSFNNLNKQRLVDIYYDKKGNKIIKITEEGRRRVLTYRYEDLKINIPKKWDKLWRLVIFDIPEVHKKARDAMTYKLKDIGFYPVQKSVFIFPHDCKNEIDFICEYFKIRDYVNYLVIKEIEDDSFLKKHFNLR